MRYAEERRIGTMVEGVWQPIKKQIKNPELVVLPSVFKKMIRGYITHVSTKVFICNHKYINFRLKFRLKIAANFIFNHFRKWSVYVKSMDS